jgi:hypothetical protein
LCCSHLLNAPSGISPARVTRCRHNRYPTRFRCPG